MVPATAPVHRLTIQDVYKMVAAGVLDENARIELVHGVLLDMAPIGPEHDGALAWLTAQFAGVRHDAWHVRVQSTFLVPGGYLLPDLMLVAPLTRSEQPETALLVVEVAQTSHARDRDKARDYAAAGVLDYWIVDLVARAVEVYRRPLAGAYEEIVTYRDGDRVTPIATGAPVVAVSELLG